MKTELNSLHFIIHPQMLHVSTKKLFYFINAKT